MDVLSIFVIAVGLAMDAFAVSISAGVTIKHPTIRDMFKFGLFFGLFQFIMPVLGFFGSRTFSVYIEAVDHWVAFGVLVIIGGKMLYETFQKDDACSPCTGSSQSLFPLKKMTLLAIATSIDAMAVGISFAVTDTNIWLAALIIGLIAFVISYSGIYIGKKLGCVFQKGAEQLGGVILIAIGVKILAEHFWL